MSLLMDPNGPVTGLPTSHAYDNDPSDAPPTHDVSKTATTAAGETT